MVNRSHGRHVNVVQLLALILALVLLAGVGGILAGGLLVPLAAGAKTVTDTAVQVFDDLPDELEPGPLSEQSVIVANDGKTVIARYWTENRIVVPQDEVSDNMQNAVVATEDKRFYEHGGVDVEGTARAAVNNFAGGDQQGASTLTQQYVKNVLIEKAVRDDDPLAIEAAQESTLERKAKEAKLAISLEKQMTKDEILEAYLNIAQFGVGIYGVETAARYYFGKNAADLNVTESATIAGITKSPTAYDPTRNPEDTESRRNIVLKLMYEQGYITKDEYDTARSSSIEDTLDVHPTEAGCQANQTYAWFCDYVTKEIVDNELYGETAEERQELLYRGGLTITTTIDPDMQKEAQKSVAAGVPADDDSGLESALASIEPGTGKILAMAQNRPYDATTEPEPFTTAINYSADPAHGNSGGFQVGSTFKPFVLAEWLRSGHTLYDEVPAAKQTYVVNQFDTSPCTRLSSQPWSPANAEGVASGNISALEATKKSVNSAYVAMGKQLNLCDLAETAWDIGYRPTTTAIATDTHAKGDKLNAPTEEDVNVFAPMIIGTQASAPLLQASAYGTFASGGTYCEPLAITKVTDTDGNTIVEPESTCTEEAIDPDIANTVAYAMTQAFTPGGTASNDGLADGRPAAAKTGTTNLSSQTWFNGYTPQISTSVWVGNAESEDDHLQFEVNGVWYTPLYGGDVAGPIWTDFMDDAVAGMPVEDFGAPSASMIGTPAPPPAPAPTSDDSDDSDSDSGDSDGGDGGDSDGGGNGNSGGNGNGNGNGGDDSGSED
ncbi:Membrane carboxypeptidase (penicillin-binding protein) [Paraoerskovia marina]|uniref:Membrane carboxypeptidase (Penicillin-binding protein) n=1 Tax=Paraoerskovia marina TaxID=545619 RepID=A0A1H1PQU8_9CELL|nr:transglycosylase domain-containing protein [Paraoerskovia marina]SDS13443.1 Membrane carboxypeptidase (penicillin-binding protein) [Paraoerskovia marina]